MALLSQQFNLGQPANVGTTNYTYTVIGTYNAQNAAFPIELDAAAITTAGRYVVLRATVNITNYAGATFAWVNGANPLVCVSVSREPVNYNGTTYVCIVVTLV